MNRQFLMFLVLFVASASAGTDKPQLTVMRAASRLVIDAPAGNFTGKATIDRQVRPDASQKIMGSMVSFEPGARTDWHTHPLGQTLVVTSGRGWVQAEGGEKEPISAGDVIWTPANVKHWHGAQPDSAMSHYDLVEPLNDSSAQWMEKVTDAQYGAE